MHGDEVDGSQHGIPLEVLYPVRVFHAYNIPISKERPKGFQKKPKTKERKKFKKIGKNRILLHLIPLSCAQDGENVS